MSTQIAGEESPTLQRSIGFIGLTFVAVGGIVGSGWLFAPLLTSQLAGPAAIVSWVLGGTAMLVLALCFAEVAGVLPVAGGIARIPHMTHGDVTSAVLGWSAWVGYNTAAPIETIAMLRYLAVDWPWLVVGDTNQGALTPAGMAVAIALLVTFVVINAFGVAIFARANAVITVIKIGIPVAVAAAILWARFEPSNFTAGDGFAPYGAEGIFAAISSGGVIFSLIGFRHAIDMAGEVRHPRVVIPAALAFSLIICVAIYVLLDIAFVASLDPSLLGQGWSSLHFDHDLGPFAAVAVALGIGWIGVTLSAGAVISPFGGGLVSTGSMARLSYALSQNRIFPGYFEALSARGVPLRCLLLNLAFGAAVVLFVPFNEAVALNGAAITLSFCAGPLAVYALRSQYPDAERRFSLPFAGVMAPISFVVATLIIYWSGWDTTWRLAASVIVGLALFAARMRAEKVTLEEIDLRSAGWLPPYLLGLVVVSYIGHYGGGAGMLRFPWDAGVVTVFALIVFALAHRLRLDNEKAALYRERYQTDPPPDMTPI